jgi:hypothetical protein
MNASELKKLLIYATKLPQLQIDYQVGGRKETYCNVYARSILSWQGARYWIRDFPNTGLTYNLQSMNPGKYLSEIMLNTGCKKAHMSVVNAIETFNEQVRGGAGLPETEYDELKRNTPRRVTEEEAQELANQGIPIWISSADISKTTGHEAIVCPNDRAFNKDKGCLIGQAGGINGIFYISDWQAFGNFYFSDASDIIFVRFPNEVV